MALDALFSTYHANWLPLCPSAKKVFDGLVLRGEKPRNDHIALRGLNRPGLGLETLAKPFLEHGYSFCGDYDFPAKKLDAKHLEHPDKTQPKVFISELRVHQLSGAAQKILTDSTNNIKSTASSSADFGTSGRHWDFDMATYETLYTESEYAAWFYAFGYRANHFTIDVNALNQFSDLAELNTWLKSELSLSLNQSGGEIKGSKTVGLMQSSTMSDHVSVLDSKGVNHNIPGCYIEFAERFVIESGELYSGFVTDSADKIFESTSR